MNLIAALPVDAQASDVKEGASLVANRHVAVYRGSLEVLIPLTFFETLPYKEYYERRLVL